MKAAEKSWCYPVPLHERVPKNERNWKRAPEPPVSPTQPTTVLNPRISASRAGPSHPHLPPPPLFFITWADGCCKRLQRRQGRQSVLADGRQLPAHQFRRSPNSLSPSTPVAA